MSFWETPCNYRPCGGPRPTHEGQRELRRHSSSAHSQCSWRYGTSFSCFFPFRFLSFISNPAPQQGQSKQEAGSRTEGRWGFFSHRQDRVNVCCHLFPSSSWGTSRKSQIDLLITKGKDPPGIPRSQMLPVYFSTPKIPRRANNEPCLLPSAVCHLLRACTTHLCHPSEHFLDGGFLLFGSELREEGSGCFDILRVTTKS